MKSKIEKGNDNNNDYSKAMIKKILGGSKYKCQDFSNRKIHQM